LLVSWKALYNQ